MINKFNWNDIVFGYCTIQKIFIARSALKLLIKQMSHAHRILFLIIRDLICCLLTAVGVFQKKKNISNFTNGFWYCVAAEHKQEQFEVATFQSNKIVWINFTKMEFFFKLTNIEIFTYLKNLQWNFVEFSENLSFFFLND